MKKYLIATVVLCMIATGSFAEQMQFITTLSEPVGIFGTVSASDASQAISAYKLNFGNIRQSGGLINTQRLAVTGDLSILSFTNALPSLSGSVGRSFTSNRIAISKKLTGGSLNVTGLANVKKVQSAQHAVSHTGNVNTKTASFEKMVMTNYAQLTTPASGNTLKNNFNWDKVTCVAGDTGCNFDKPLLVSEPDSVVPNCNGASLSQSCGCHRAGTQTRTCTAGVLSDWGACSIDDCHEWVPEGNSENWTTITECGVNFSGLRYNCTNPNAHDVEVPGCGQANNNVACFTSRLSCSEANANQVCTVYRCTPSVGLTPGEYQSIVVTCQQN